MLKIAVIYSNRIIIPPKYAKHSFSNVYLKGEFDNFINDLSDAPKYDIIWTENRDVIDSFIPEILMFKECSKR